MILYVRRLLQVSDVMIAIYTLRKCSLGGLMSDWGYQEGAFRQMHWRLMLWETWPFVFTKTTGFTSIRRSDETVR